MPMSFAFDNKLEKLSPLRELELRKPHVWLFFWFNNPEAVDPRRGSVLWVVSGTQQVIGFYFVDDFNA